MSHDSFILILRWCSRVYLEVDTVLCFMFFLNLSNFSVVFLCFMIASDFNVFRDQFVDWWSCTCFLHTVCELSSPWNWKMPGPANQRRSRFSNLSEVGKRCKSLAKLGLVSDRFWLYEISTLPKKLRTESPTMTACSETATARPITAWRKDSCENLKNHGLTLSLIFFYAHWLYLVKRLELCHWRSSSA